MAEQAPTALLVVDGQAEHWAALARAAAAGEFPYPVVFAATGRQALDLLAGQRFGAALVRHTLPDGSAFELVAQLDCPVVIAAVEESELVVAARALHAGFSDYLMRDPAGDYVALLAAKLVAAWRHVEVVTKLRESGRELVKKSQDLQVTLDSISQGISKVEPDGSISLMNRRFVELLELPEPLAAKRPLTLRDLLFFQKERGDFGHNYELIDGQARERIRESTEAGFPDSSISRVPDWYLRKTRAGRTLEVKTRAFADGGVVRTYTDVTDYMEAQVALGDSEARYRNLTDLSSDWNWEMDADLRFSKFGGNMHLAGTDLMRRIGKHAWDSPAANMSSDDWLAHRAQLEAHQVFRNLELQRVSDDGHIRWTAVSGAPFFDAQGQFLGYRGIGRDITEHKRVEAEIERLAFYDLLTGLPNRRLLLDRLRLALPACARRHDHGALLFLDLDNFKIINDTQGHHMGDALLQQVAERLSRCVRQIDTVARLGGDEFVVMLEELSSDAEEAATQVEAVGKKILASLNQPFRLAGQDHSSTPSIGVALFSDQLQDVDELLKRADMAMYQAKSAGRNTLRFFDPHMQAAATARAALEVDLRLGLQRGELVLYYQPVVDVQRRITGVEALVRWRHPQRGLVSPGEFIPVAEQSGLILPLGQRVLESACRQLVAWRDSPATQKLSVAVNVSARQFRHPEFASQILTLLRQTGANPYRLKLELTESLLLSDLEDAIVKMTELRSIGVSFALDDFGTGYSSLSYLKRLPLDQLKIDQSFVRDVLTDPNDAAIARTILTLAQSLDLAVVAEGVETNGQWQFLLKNGCKAFQGYLFGRPVPVEELVLG
jgi:diguanylate cyclase (GGDEF)-like protein/PAS domain S-box-containing protein